MKRIIPVLLLLVFISITPLYAWKITSYNTIYDVKKTNEVIVTETITVDFADEQRHGIYRDIPISGKDRFKNNYKLRFKLISVTDGQNNNLKYSKKMTSRKVNIKIGDPNKTISGVNVYVIKYQLKRVIRFFDEHDELYANAVGSEWTVSIDNASCIVKLPDGIPSDKIMITSYTGARGSISSDADSKIISKNSVGFTMQRPIYPGEFMTIVVGWPKGIVEEPSFKQEAVWFISDNGCFLAPFLLILVLIALWWKNGRDPDRGGAVTVMYEPPDNMIPAELGTLIDERVDMKDISASIIDLAVRGYITIKPEKEKSLLGYKPDYLLKLNPQFDSLTTDESLTKFEYTLLKNIFGGHQSKSLSMLEGVFYTSIPHLQDDLYESMVKNGYFANRPDEVRMNYGSAGCLTICLGIAAIFVSMVFDLGHYIPLGWGISVILCGIILLIGARAMPRKTVKGSKALREAKGFKEYLSRAEKNEIIFQERTSYFEKFLPYAMVFGIAHKWAMVFEDLQDVPPSWYEGDYQTFKPSLFIHDLNIVSANMANSMSKHPQTEGSGSSSSNSGFSGGSSGGGSGGGGGGAW